MHFMSALLTQKRRNNVRCMVQLITITVPPSHLFEVFFMFSVKFCNSSLDLRMILGICVHKCQIFKFRLQEGNQKMSRKFDKNKLKEERIKEHRQVRKSNIHGQIQVTVEFKEKEQRASLR